MKFHSFRLGVAFIVASLLPLVLQVIGLFVFSGSVRDMNGNLAPDRISKYMDIMFYAQGPFTILVTVAGLAVLLSVAKAIGASYSRGIVVLAAALGLVAGAALEGLLLLGAPQVVTPSNAVVVLVACALLSAAIAATFCVLAGVPWRER